MKASFCRLGNRRFRWLGSVGWVFADTDGVKRLSNDIWSLSPISDGVY